MRQTPAIELYHGTELMDPATEDRKTLAAAGLNDRSLIQVKVGNGGATYTSSPDSSGESSPNRTPQHERVSNAELEHLLPSSVLSQKSDYVQFLFSIADLGIKIDDQGLKNGARKLLRQIPANPQLLDTLAEACVENANQRLESLFFSGSPTEVLYFLELTHAALLPARPIPSVNDGRTTAFQTALYNAGGLTLCLNMLAQNNFLHQVDEETRQDGHFYMLRLLKFNLYIA